MRTGIGTKKLAVTFTCNQYGTYMTVWVDGNIVGASANYKLDKISIRKDNKEMQVTINGVSIWVKPKWIKLF